MENPPNPVFWLKRAYLSTRKHLDDSLQKDGLTAAQLEVLMYLWEENGMEHRVLQEHLGVSSPTLTSVIDVMVQRGYVERRTSAEDSRVKQLFLTEKGQSLSQERQSSGQRFIKEMMSGFSEGESILFIEWLQRVARNMGDTYHTPH
jgi:MarR family transcriptional regulator, transcriptional regulator for hemolysin